MPIVLASGSVASLELETLTGGDLPPRVRFTVSGDATVREYRLARMCEGETVNLPKWRARSFSDVVVDTDWAAPLNRPATYSLYADGALVLTAVIQLDYATAVIQDPVDPTLWMPVSGTDKAPGQLTMQAMGAVEYPAEQTLIPVLGARYPTAIGGQVQRGSVGALDYRTYDAATAAAFRELALSTPVLLLRTTVDMAPLPALSYLSGRVSEVPETVHFGGGMTAWRSSPSLVQAVQAAAVSGHVTYDEVQQLLAGLTYDEVQAAASATTYLDWQKNPLIYATL